MKKYFLAALCLLSLLPIAFISTSCDDPECYIDEQVVFTSATIGVCSDTQWYYYPFTPDNFNIGRDEDVSNARRLISKYYTKDYLEPLKSCEVISCHNDACSCGDTNDDSLVPIENIWSSIFPGN